jgi:16S rRNA (adenine1518-N6/adenine1519-N6)-dimethyltransferase
MHTKAELLTLLRADDIRLTKRLGQHYLIDPYLCERLVGLCDITPEDAVVEIGAGLGALTDLLATQAREVLAIEIDRAICELLKTRMNRLPNVHVLCQDILTFRWDCKPGSKVVGTIPYQITSPILVKLCEHSMDVPEAWLGLQQEVASRLDAKPRTKAYGRLSILVQYYFETKPLMRISRAAFFPRPAVDSVWIRLSARRRRPASVNDERLFFDVVRAAFSQRRKTLLNCLGMLGHPRLDRSEAAQIIQRLGLRDGVRGEELSIEAFARLANAIGEL